MAYQALYRKYRPDTFSSVVGQDHVTKTLKAGVRDGKTVHAYLFTGTRGTGKTTCAKILAKAVNCLDPKDGDPCGECEICRAAAEGTLTDIVEIDAASNNGVDNVRELREQVNFPPARAKYRVYIIDEVHMLSQGAFNALLKTLEEPPAHVIFILATTEVHKLPATILSRCQRYDFKRIDDADISARLKAVASEEGLGLTDNSAALIAGIADGALRDALSILDLCAAASTDITEETVFDVCSMASNDYLLRLADCVKSRDTEGALKLIDELHGKSVDMHRLLDELTRHFRDIMIIKTVKDGKLPIVCSAAHLAELKEQAKGFDLPETVAILDILRECSQAAPNDNGRITAEMTMIRLCNPAIRNDISSLELRLSALEAAIASGVPAKPALAEQKPAAQQQVTAAKTPTEAAPEKVGETATPQDEEVPVPTSPDEPAAPAFEDAPAEPQTAENPQVDEKPQTPPAANARKAEPVAAWEDVLAVLEVTCPIIAGVLKGSAAYIKGDCLLIDSDNGQFKSLCNGKNNVYRESIRKAAQKILGVSYRLGPYKKEDENAGEDPLKIFAEKLKSFEN